MFYVLCVYIFLPLPYVYTFKCLAPKDSYVYILSDTIKVALSFLIK